MPRSTVYGVLRRHARLRWWFKHAGGFPVTSRTLLIADPSALETARWEGDAGQVTVGEIRVDHAGLPVDRRLAELDHLPQQHADRGVAHAPVLRQCRFPLIRSEELQHRPQIREVEKREPMVVRVLKDHGQDAGLGVVQGEHLPEQQRPE